MFRLRLYLMLVLLPGPAACEQLESIEVAVLGASPTPIPSSTPTQTTTATQSPTLAPTLIPTATPSPSPTLLADTRINAGERALRNGDWEQARLAFTEAHEHGAYPHVSAAALLGLATTYLRDNRAPEAVETLYQYVQTYSKLLSVKDAYFLLGEAFMAQDRWAQATQNYRQYLQVNPGVIDSYVWERIGDAHFANGDYATAADAFGQAILAERSGNLNFLLLDKARALQLLGNFPEALTLYDLVNNNTEYYTTRAQMDYMRGQTELTLGNTQQAYQHFTHALDHYPTAFHSYLSLTQLVNTKVTVNDLQRGLVNYNAAQYLPAIQSLQRYVDRQPTHDARAHYYIALSHRELDDWRSALQHFNEVIATHPKDALWDDAWIEAAYTQWGWGGDYSSAIQTYLGFVEEASQHPTAPIALSDAARAAERQGDISKAARLWGRAADEYPNASIAARSAFLSGISLYREQALTKALARFEQAHALASGDLPTGAALVWMGKTQHALGAEQKAIESWEAAAKADPDGYYGLRAGELTDGFSPFLTDPAANLEFPAQEEQERTEAWLADKLGLNERDSLGELSDEMRTDGRWRRGQTLWRLGMTEDARSELQSLMRYKQDEALASYQLALAYRDLGYYYGALRSARNSLYALGLANTVEAPQFISHLRYGPYYQDLIVPASQAYGLDPRLVYAVVRQESLFQGTVVSSAYAQGLMQIIPATGDWIATQISWPNYQNSDLYLPYINVEFGTYYLAQQVDAFGDNIYAALAAYNAGPGNANIWHQIAGNDYDLFLEVIRLEEPQRYIRRVREHYAVYSHLYDG